MDTMEIKSRNGAYQVHFDYDLPGALRASGRDGNAFLLVDESLSKFHREAIAEVFPDTSRVFFMQATEENKSYDKVSAVFTWLLSSGFRRDSILVAFGGGIVQDVACFVATVIMRGVRWRLIPTTLLAQCDSCIGAKSSINIGRFKNQLGSFYAPIDIYLITSLLKTLPEEAIRSGFGEIVKFHLLDSEASWHDIKPKLRWDDEALLSDLIHKSLLIKKRSIEIDEFDRGVRNLLNYGHTFGHAFESATTYAIPHGLAVALGISAATFVSEKIGMAPVGHYHEVDSIMKRLYGDFAELLRASSIDDIIRAMGTDKKNMGGATYAILTRGPGRMEKVKVELQSRIRPLINEFIRQL